MSDGTPEAQHVPTIGRDMSEDKRKKVAKFYFGLIAQAEKQPTVEWNKARAAYESEFTDKATDQQHANIWRAKVDTQAAFQDSEPAKVRFMPPEWAGDEEAREEAECVEHVYSYLDREQGIRAQISRMGHSADVTNNGFVAVRFDQRKRLPGVFFLENDRVAIDGDCGGWLDRAEWVAYYEMIAAEDLAEWYPDVPFEALRDAARKNEEATTHDDGREADRVATVSNSLQKCKVWRFFARGKAALYDREPATTPADREGQPHFERFRKRHGLEEPRRYLFLIEGVEVPLEDMDGWPPEYLLDTNEWPLEHLTNNRGYDTVYGHTDYRHERALLQELERAVTNIVARHGIDGLKLGGHPSLKDRAEEIKQWLQKPGVQFLPHMLDANGKPLIQPVETNALTQHDLAYISQLQEMYDQISMQPRASRGDEDPGKTATASQIESDWQNARNNFRLRQFEWAIANVARKVMQMARVTLRRLTWVEVPRLPEDGGGYAVIEMLAAEANAALSDPAVDADLIQVGVEAMVGPELSAYWQDWPTGGIEQAGRRRWALRNLRVSVERGSTQRSTRLQKVKAFVETYVQMILPVITQLGAIDAAIESASKVLSMQDLDEFDTIIASLRATLESAQAAQEAEQAAAQAAQTQGMPVDQSGVVGAGLPAPQETANAAI